jgi:hypothetical protein
MTVSENAIVAADEADHDEEILKMRIAGASPRAIAKQLGCSIGDVNRCVDRLAASILDSRYRARTIALELERLDRLTMQFFQTALAGDTAAGSLLVKISERRGDLVGLNSPVKVDLIAQEPQPRQTSTDRIMAAIDRIAGKQLPKPGGAD